VTAHSLIWPTVLCTSITSPVANQGTLGLAFHYLLVITHSGAVSTDFPDISSQSVSSVAIIFGIYSLCSSNRVAVEEADHQEPRTATRPHHIRMESSLGTDLPQSSLYDVYLGVWTNWSHGRVLGSTLTLNRQNGDLVIAFAAFFVAFVGTRTWRIACIILHYRYSSQGPQDAVHHQRQAILRNSPNPESGLMSFLELLFAWKERDRAIYQRIIQRVLLALILAFVCLTGFIIASGFSSRISTSTGTEVLLTGNNCGWLRPDRDSESEAILTYLTPYWSKQTASFANYAKECYSSNTSGVLDCGVFVRRQLGAKGTANFNASCPFGGNICTTNDSNIFLDSGPLDSNDDLGLNAPQDQRFTYRRLLQCAPLKTKGFRSTYNISQDKSITAYHYGNPILVGDSPSNITYEYSDDWVADRQRYLDHALTASPEYSLG
jgi:hypothetical protein